MDLRRTDREVEIIERLKKITPLPWFLEPENCGPGGQGIFNEDGGPIVEVGDPYPRGNNHPQENMDFIVHAPEDVEWLLTELTRLREANYSLGQYVARRYEQVQNFLDSSDAHLAGMRTLFNVPPPLG